MSKIKFKYFNLPLDRPYLTIILSIIATILLAIGILGIRIDDDFVKMFPDNIPSKVVWDEIQEEFGATEYLVVAFGNKNDNQSISKDKEAYSHLTSLIKKYERWNKDENLIDQIISIIQYSFNNEGSFDSFINYDENQRNRFIKNNYVLLYIVPEVGINNSRLVEGIKNITKDELSDYDVHFAGQPYLAGETPNLISKDIRILMLIGIIVMILVLGFNLKSFYAVLSVFITILLSLAGMIGFMGWLYIVTGYDMYNFTILSTSMPIILLTIANSDGVHIVSRFRIEVKKEKDVKIAIVQTLKKLRKPIFLTSITTAVAFLAMISSPIPHMIGYGIVIAFGVIWAWILSTTLLPSLLYVKKWNLNSKAFNKDSIIERLIRFLSQKIIKKPKKVLFISILIVAISFIGIWFVKVEVNVIQFFKKDTSIRQSTDFVDKELFGSMSFVIKAEDDFSDIENIILLDDLQNRIQNIDLVPEIKQSISYADIIKESFRTFNAGFKDTLISRIFPESNNQLFQIHDFSTSNNRIAKIISDNKKKTIIASQMETVSTERASKIANLVNLEIQDFKKETDSNMEFETTGLLVFLQDFVSMVVQSSLTSIIVSILAIGLIVLIFFKRIYWSLLSAIPLLTAIILNFGIMGLIGVELSHLTALLTSIIIGVGVDFSIHYISDYRSKIKDNFPLKDRNLKTSQDVGYPIMLDVASNLGFAALLFSSIIPLNYMGGLMVFAMISTSFGTLTILSSIIELMKHRIKA